MNVKLKEAQYVKNTVELLQMKSIIALLLPANEVWGKLIFLLAFRILSMWWGGGGCAFYWNAFLSCINAVDFYEIVFS